LPLIPKIFVAATATKGRGSEPRRADVVAAVNKELGMRQGLSRRAFLPLAGAMMIPPVAKAQGFPKRPISLVVPCPAGGSLDPVARTIAHE
jgi:hypothetical protein